MAENHPAVIGQSTEMSVPLLLSPAFAEDARGIGIVALEPDIQVMQEIVDVIAGGDVEQYIPDALFLRSVSPNRLGSKMDINWPYAAAEAHEGGRMRQQHCYKGTDILTDHTVQPEVMYDCGLQLHEAKVKTIGQMSINLRRINDTAHTTEAFARSVFTTLNRTLPIQSASHSHMDSGITRSLLNKRIKSLPPHSPFIISWSSSSVLLREPSPGG